MIGQIIGNYKITEKIGEGGMGAVFKGLDFMLEREVAIKMLRPELAQQPHVVERFRLEAITLAKLSHPNIATLHTFLRRGNDFFMVMEFVAGKTLSSLIKQVGALPCDQAISLLCQALEGIEHAHEFGIIHRDIKSENMMLTQKGSIKVMDFGIARVLGTDRMTRHGHLVGTIEYMAPEQVRGEEADLRSDIYSTGIVLYEMVTGRLPFNSDSDYALMKMQVEQHPQLPRRFAPSIPAFVEEAIIRALNKDPESRFQSASQFRYALLGRGQHDSPAAYIPAPSMVAVSTPIASSSHAALDPERKLEQSKSAGNETGNTAPVGDQIKPTRLAQDIQPPLNQPVAHGVREEFQAPQHQADDLLHRPIARNDLTPSPGSKRSWKVKAAVATALSAIVIAGSYVFISGGSSNSNANSNVGQPAQSSAGSPALKSEPKKPAAVESTKPQVPDVDASNQSKTGNVAIDSFQFAGNANQTLKSKKSRQQDDADSARARRAKAAQAEKAEMERIRARIKDAVRKNQ
ncbi:MAG TPA: serine/threonine-protein kinase [Blastocatellia bacterium]|nr:serine/threonine-protein kinase [Blastocatellia bacterium]